MSSRAPYGDHQDLPKQFLSSLKVLFDILDEDRSGLVHLSDIESKWKGDGEVSCLPAGVIQSWKKVAFPDNKLDFERFIAGIRMALTRRSVSSSVPQRKPSGSAPPNSNYDRNNINQPLRNQKPTGVAYPRPDLIAHHQPTGINHGAKPPRIPSPTRQYSQETNAYSNYVNQQNMPVQHEYRPVSQSEEAGASVNRLRTISMPQLSNAVNPAALTQPQNRSLSPSHLAEGNNNNKENIVDVLKKWQHDRSADGKTIRDASWGDQRASVASMSALDRYSKPESRMYESDIGSVDDGSVGIGIRKRVNRRSDVRRHTVSNGIDFQMIKRMKQLEMEKDMLLQGLEAVDRARHWYHTQLHTIQEKQKYLGNTVPQDYNLDSHQEKINMQSARITELNQQLTSLVESSSKGLPLHMNLALTPSTPQKSPPRDNLMRQLQEQNNLMNRLKQQNKQLTHEVCHKSDRISQLELEKSQLVRDVFQPGQKPRKYEESSYI